MVYILRFFFFKMQFVSCCYSETKKCSTWLKILSHFCKVLVSLVIKQFSQYFFDIKK